MTLPRAAAFEHRLLNSLSPFPFQIFDSAKLYLKRTLLKKPDHPFLWPQFLVTRTRQVIVRILCGLFSEMLQNSATNGRAKILIAKRHILGRRIPSRGTTAMLTPRASRRKHQPITASVEIGMMQSAFPGSSCDFERTGDDLGLEFIMLGGEPCCVH